MQTSINTEKKTDGRVDNSKSENAADTAREAFRRLAREKLPPTPENFSAMYADVSGHAVSPDSAGVKREKVLAEQALRTALLLADRLPCELNQRESLTSAIRRGAWHVVDDLVAELKFQQTPVEVSQAGMQATAAWRDTTQNALKCSAPIYKMTAELKREAANNLRAIRGANSAEDFKPLRQNLQEFSNRLLEFRVIEERSQLQLKSLLSAIVKNVGSLSADEGWLSGQMTRVDQALKDGVDDTALRNIEATLRDAARQQKDLKFQLDHAKDALRDMITTLIAQLGDMADSTGEFSFKVEGYATAIESAEDLAGVTSVVHELLSDTRDIHLKMTASKDELTEAQSRAALHEAKVKSLEAELVEVSDLVKTDHLTQALSRRGLESAYESEMTRLDRAGEPLCMAAIDIDNFKSLNDKHGHHAGDDALRHLSKVMRNALRPTDILARQGGEEFVVLLPNTTIEVAVQVTERLQRQLTREFFLHDDEKLFITFSAGVTTVVAGEAQQSALDRADQALYKAKNAGKNRVFAG